MTLPAYWLPRPAIAWSDTVTDQLEAVYRHDVEAGTGDWIAAPLPVPLWAFLCWLTDHQGVLLHGSGNAAITAFEPRTPDDHSPDDFSKQTAVFAASDGIWAMWYAILERTRYRLNMLNGALQFELLPGERTPMHYFFSVTAEVLRRQPWRDGVVYILPREGFVQQPPYELGGRTVHEPHWARITAVRSLAKVRVKRADFPFLDQVRGHDPNEVQQRAARDPYGFPWLDA